MEQIDNIMKSYSIDLTSYKSLSKGYASRKWIIVDKNKNRYLLKEIKNQSINRLCKILQVQSKLYDFSPKIIKTKNNELYVNYEYNSYYLSEFIESERLDVISHVRDIGLFLAMLHKKMFEVKNIHTTFLKVENNLIILNEYLKYHKLHNHTEYVEIIKYKLSILGKLKITDINFNNLTKQIIHGDFYGDNILYTNSSYKIVDFDQCCEFYKEYEVLRGMFMLFSDSLLSKEELYRMKEFIDGYYTLEKIKSPKDAYNLYLYIQANSLSSIKPDDYGKYEKMSFAKKRFRILKCLVENKENVMKILEGDYR